LIRYQPAFQPIFSLFFKGGKSVCHKSVKPDLKFNICGRSGIYWLFFIDFCVAIFKKHEMFEGLQQKWKVKGGQLALILCTFAIGGSATGWVAKKIMNVLAIEQDWLWAVIYIILVTICWPLMVILISIPFGQFPFFSRYIKKLGSRIGLVRSKTPDINE